MTKRKIHTAYGPKRKDTATKVSGHSYTKQSFSNDADINQIMARFIKTGLIENYNSNKAEYGFAPAIDYHTAANLITKAQQQFDGLPAKVRTRFKNSPQEFLEFCENPDNRSEAAILGLLDPEASQPESPPAQASDSASAPLARNPADVEPTHESA